MRKNHKKDKETKTKIAAGVLLAAVFVLAGCGGGGINPISISPDDNISALDNRQTEGRQTYTGATGNSFDYPSAEGINELYAMIERLPESAFTNAADANWKDKHPRAHEKKLLEILERVNKDIENGKFENARKAIENEFIPKVDGCSGGLPENDLISDCSAGDALYEQALEIIELLNSAPANGGKTRSSARTAAMSFEDYKAALLLRISELKSDITAMPDTAFKDPAADSRKKLTDILTASSNELNNGRYDRAVNKLIEFVSKTDGYSGGDPNNDLISDMASQLQTYEKAVAILNPLSENSLASVQALKDRIAALPDSAFLAPADDSRKKLLDKLTDVINEIGKGNYLAATKKMVEFMTKTDGYSGGDPNNDLLLDENTQLSVFKEALQTVSPLSITQITVTPASALMEAGQTMQFTATCLYSDLVEKECNSELTWTSDAPAVANFTAPGALTAYSAGDAAVSASADDANSDTLPVKVVPAGVFKDLFNDSYLGADKWSDVYKSESAALTMNGGALSMSGGAYQYAEIVPTEAFYVGYGEEVMVQADLDLAGSAGGFYVQGFGMLVGNTTGLAVGLLNGDSYAQPNLYYSSPSAYGRVPAARKATVRVVYKGGQAKVYLNDMSAPIATFNAYVDGREVIFFLYASASGSGAQYNVLYDNYWTNQTEPGETAIRVENVTRPFLPDGTGGVRTGETLRVIVNAAPNSGRVQIGLLDTGSMTFINSPVGVVDQPSPGVYAMDFVMPSAISASKIAAVGSDDKFTGLKVHTRKIPVVSSGAGRIAAGRADAPASPLPDFVLPEELRGK